MYCAVDSWIRSSLGCCHWGHCRDGDSIVVLVFHSLPSSQWLVWHMCLLKASDNLKLRGYMGKNWKEASSDPREVLSKGMDPQFCNWFGPTAWSSILGKDNNVNEWGWMRFLSVLLRIPSWLYLAFNCKSWPALVTLERQKTMWVCLKHIKYAEIATEDKYRTIVLEATGLRV